MNMDRSSFSRYACATICRKKYYWRYVRNLVPKEESKALGIGKLFHLGVANLGTEEDKQKPWYEIGQLARSYWNVTGPCEVAKTFDLGQGLSIKYVADGIEDGYLIEYKTTSDASADNVTAQAMSLQLRLGCLLFSLKGTKLRLVKKPLIRQKKGESEHEFDQRYFNLFRDEPQNHFLEIIVPALSEGALAEFNHIHSEVIRCERANVWPMAVPMVCKGKVSCEYMPLCSDAQTNMPLFMEKPTYEVEDSEI